MYTQTNIHIVFVCFPLIPCCIPLWMPFWIPLLDSMMDVILDSILDVILDTTSVFNSCIPLSDSMLDSVLDSTFGYQVGSHFWIPLWDSGFGFQVWIQCWIPLWIPSYRATPGQRRGHGGATAGQPFGARPGNRPLTIL